MRQFGTLLIAVLAVVVSCPAPAAHHEKGHEQKAVLITGASTGIGRNMAETLAEKGYFVYAGARKQKDLDALNAIDNIQAIRLDVTVQDEIDTAVKTVTAAGRGLYGLVNNAGVFTGGPLIETDIGELEWIFDVNVLGVYRVTQAFAPLILESKGRIINISSISGALDWPLGGMYTMSKHAVETYTDTLALELERFGVGVSAIEPGNFKSDISQSARKRLSDKAVANEDTRYAEEWAGFSDSPADRSQYKEPDAVTAAALHALSSESPRLRYMVVPDQQEAEWTITELVTELVQWNGDQPYSYSRDQLIEMLDAAINAEAGE
jgi:NAD(P)-dependent dehydrogenase (short-subunit alcohol dehydrogenase family)